jgi:hypothetical protein
MLAEAIPLTQSTVPSPSRWMHAPSPEVLALMVGGRELVKVRLSAVTLSTPFGRLTTDFSASEPTWDDVPAAVQAAVIPAQPTDAAPKRLELLPKSIRYCASRSDHYFIDLSGTFGDYLGKLSQNSRHNLRRRVRRFTEFSGGQIRWAAYRSIEQASEFYRLAAAVSSRSWNEEVGGPGFSGTVSEERVRGLAGQDCNRGYVLFDGERPVAFAYCEIHDTDVAYLKIGYDQEYAKWSPGTVLFYLLLESLFAERKYGLFDFKEGELWYKRMLATGSKRCSRVIYLRRNPKNLALVITHWSVGSLSRAAGEGLAKVGVKQGLKRLMMGKSLRPGQDS